MGTRSGDLDPAVHAHLHRELGWSLDDIDRALNRESGPEGAGRPQRLPRGRGAPRRVATRPPGWRSTSTAYRIRKYVGAYIRGARPRRRGGLHRRRRPAQPRAAGGRLAGLELARDRGRPGAQLPDRAHGARAGVHRDQPGRRSWSCRPTRSGRSRGRPWPWSGAGRDYEGERSRRGMPGVERRRRPAAAPSRRRSARRRRSTRSGLRSRSDTWGYVDHELADAPPRAPAATPRRPLALPR